MYNTSFTMWVNEHEEKAEKMNAKFIIVTKKIGSRTQVLW